MTTVNMINPLPRSTNFYPLVVGEALGVQIIGAAPVAGT